MTDLKSLLDDVERALDDIANGYLGDQTAEQQFIWAQEVARSTLSRLVAARAEMDGGKADAPGMDWDISPETKASIQEIDDNLRSAAVRAKSLPALGSEG